MEFLRVTNIMKRFANHTALNNVSLTVEKGKVFGLLGPNGAGKTTLIRIINQIIAPDEGKVFFNNQPLKPSDVEQIGYLPEERGLYKKMNVGEQAMYLARLKGLSRQEATVSLKYWFERFEITTWWNRKVEELSKGMQQKVQFIVTILHKPQLLIFDEPFSGFDPINAKILKDEILRMKSEGVTIIFSTHNMESVEQLCDNIALINKSEKILDGRIDEIKNKYKSNIFEVKFKGAINDTENSQPDLFQFLDISTNPESTVAKIKLSENISTNALINNIIQKGEIISFNEIIPSMNDIFIRVVNESKKTT